MPATYEVNGRQFVVFPVAQPTGTFPATFTRRRGGRWAWCGVRQHRAAAPAGAGRRQLPAAAAAAAPHAGAPQGGGGAGGGGGRRRSRRRWTAAAERRSSRSRCREVGSGLAQESRRPGRAGLAPGIRVDGFGLGRRGRVSRSSLRLGSRESGMRWNGLGLIAAGTLAASAPRCLGAGGGQKPGVVPDGDWQTLNRDYAATRYSPLKQINAGNVADARAGVVCAAGGRWLGGAACRQRRDVRRERHDLARARRRDRQGDLDLLDGDARARRSSGAPAADAQQPAARPVSPRMSSSGAGGGGGTSRWWRWRSRRRCGRAGGALPRLRWSRCSGWRCAGWSGCGRRRAAGPACSRWRPAGGGGAPGRSGWRTRSRRRCPVDLGARRQLLARRCDAPADGRLHDEQPDLAGRCGHRQARDLVR